MLSSIYSFSFLHTTNPSLDMWRKSKVLFGLKKSTRINKAAVENKNSEFELNPDEAREALRKLDEQLQSFSTKQVSTPKFRAADMMSSQGELEEESSESSGSFWGYAVLFLLLFTIFYNILFATVIKPSIDGPQPVESAEKYEVK